MGDKIVVKPDASDLKKIEEMKKHGDYVSKPKPKEKIPLVRACVWVSEKMDMPGFELLNSVDTPVWWYNFLNEHFSEEFND